MAQLHHLVITTECLNKRVSQFQTQFGFKVFAHRTQTSKTTMECSVAMSCHSIVLVVVEKSPNTTSYCEEITDVAWHVLDIDQAYQSVVSSGAAITSPLQRQPSEFSSFTIQSPFPSVQHTIISGPCRCGALDTTEESLLTCLPGFVPCRGNPCNICSSRFSSLSPPCSSGLRSITHVDHVTFACPVGSASSVLSWYKRCLDLKQLDIYSSSESGGDGFIIPGDNGMRMVAMQYWLCSEMVLSSSPANSSKRPVILVLAEPLHGEGENQVTTFLNHNGGPGVQHVALHTDNIINAVSSLRSNGVEFIKPPPEYYSLLEKVKEIQAAGEEVSLLQENCILIDSEVTDDRESGQRNDCRYLMQVFSKPLFEKETLFFEIIQRCGANGFGEGNIQALWKALDIHLSNQSV